MVEKIMAVVEILHENLLKSKSRHYCKKKSKRGQKSLGGRIISRGGRKISRSGQKFSCFVQKLVAAWSKNYSQWSKN